jgi:DNA invertase Pin-like site-specific DNA recombinase
VTVRAYVRVSTDSQAATGHGLDAQRKTIAAEADRRGWEDVVWYIDGGFSGKDLDRPAMADLLSVIRCGDVLVIAKLDRLSRSLSDFADLMERAQRQKWNVVALDLGIDLSTPNGEFMASVLAAMARWERRIIGQRTKEGMAAARAKGVLPGRRSAVPPEVQARLLAMRDQGLTLTVIANRLNADGVPTATGTRWTTSAVYSSTRSAALEMEAKAASRAV